MDCGATAHIGGSSPGAGGKQRSFNIDIDGLIAELVAAGLESASWRRVERYMGLREYLLMQSHWQQNGPPVYMMVASYIGWNPQPKSQSQDDDNDDETPLNAAEHVDELMRMMGMANG